MRTLRRRGVVAMVSTGLAAGLLAACSSGGGTTGVTANPGATSAGASSLTIGISFDQPGLGLKSGNTYSGFDVLTAVYIAKSMGVPEANITWVEADPGDRENLLIDGKVDMVLSTYSITEARKQKIDFAGPYFVAHQDLLIRRNDVQITGPDTLDGRKLCSVAGTTSAQLVTQQYAGKITLTPKSKFSDCVASLVNGDVDAVTTDDVILAGFAAEPQYKGILKVVGKGFSEERYGVGLKKGDSAMVTKVNDALKAYIADGSWNKALDATVGPSGYAIPSPPTPGSA
ncbi:glutamate ABC transporter substrate-binding protein [Lapillicoccus sp.]|uniref:glutamate ABC transporter substrate-binding protein n=1 Tax=Lapillicoccus sp. TaxID=1909287 RepID=UPI0032630A15